MSEMMILTMFAMVGMMGITRVEISKKSKCANKLQFRNFENTVNLIYTVCAMSEKMI